MKKKLVSVILISAAMVLSLTACGKKNTTDNANADMSLAPLVETLPQLTEASPEVESNSVGLMAFYPNSNENMYALAGTNAVTFYFENKGIQLGDGKIGVYEAETNNIYSTVDVADTSSFVIDEMDSVGTSLTGWESGTKIDVYFSKIFETGKSYYVLMDEGVFSLGSVSSAPVTNASLITFSVKNYGVDITGVNLKKTYKVGDTVALNVLVDSEGASMYALKEYDQTFITATPDSATTSSAVSLTFEKPGTPSVTIAFFKGGKQVDSVTFSFPVADENGVVASSDANSSASEDASK
ncbi:hypothetical protein [Butyrivibrio hungatei]|uniref:Uncharacterized protein n=1 Tax=Butyrivibrio hungatei TaxID=185008 RepID=A0A1D9P5I7_9FIRM|nr:hypothetical protein [Butyrivibrio hungatei]AOZ97847.1 hypothetical protein bhn_II048 [Butyrivibrio hungatei]